MTKILYSTIFLIFIKKASNEFLKQQNRPKTAVTTAHEIMMKKRTNVELFDDEMELKERKKLTQKIKEQVLTSPTEKLPPSKN